MTQHKFRRRCFQELASLAALVNPGWVVVVLDFVAAIKTLCACAITRGVTVGERLKMAADGPADHRARDKPLEELEREIRCAV